MFLINAYYQGRLPFNSPKYAFEKPVNRKLLLLGSKFLVAMHFSAPSELSVGTNVGAIIDEANVHGYEEVIHCMMSLCVPWLGTNNKKRQVTVSWHK